jgi:hypothetical protein
MIRSMASAMAVLTVIQGDPNFFPVSVSAMS